MRVLRTRGTEPAAPQCDLVAANLNSELEVTPCAHHVRLENASGSDVRGRSPVATSRAGVPQRHPPDRALSRPIFGQPITVFDPTSRGAVAYRELAKEVSNGASKRTGKAWVLSCPLRWWGTVAQPCGSADLEHPAQRAPARSHFDERRVVAGCVIGMGVLQPICPRSRWRAESMSSSRGAALEGGAPGPAFRPSRSLSRRHERRPRLDRHLSRTSTGLTQRTRGGSGLPAVDR